jgi:hypothetical protein
MYYCCATTIRWILLPTLFFVALLLENLEVSYSINTGFVKRLLKDFFCRKKLPQVVYMCANGLLEQQEF